MVVYQQDMPPAGGYSPINFKRVPPKLINIWKKLGAYIGITTIGWILYYRQKRIITNERIEMRCALFAIIPLLTAENDRAVLLNLKKNRDYEEKLMENNPDWELGKWKKLPVYLTLGPNEFFKPCMKEYFAHSEPKIYNFLYNLSLYT